jgi:hypothetical protein
VAKQLLHLVFGGEVVDAQGVEFTDADNLDIVGIFPNHQAALEAWRGASQARVDGSPRQIRHRSHAPIAGPGPSRGLSRTGQRELTLYFKKHP